MTALPDAIAVDPARPLPGAGGGLPACAATDRRATGPGLMALAVPPGLAPRHHPLTELPGKAIESLLLPLGLATAPGPTPGVRAQYVICRAPPGPALAETPGPWPEAALLDQVLRPAAAALAALAALGLTHRAIRAENVFRPGPGQPVTLGSAWAAPPAMHQPAIAEPPYVAMCLPEGRGNGRPADDIYALGVLLLCLALGEAPLADLPTDAVIRAKLAHGSFEALTAGRRLPALLSDLLRGMLAEDPEHRPPATLLADPLAARARRLAARPPRRAAHGLRVGAEPVGDARSLAYAIATAPEAGLRALRSGAVDLWLRRELGDTALAMRLEDQLHLRSAHPAEANPASEALLLTRAVAILDPLAPIAWQGEALWPDGLGPALAIAPPDRQRALGSMVTSEAVSAWGEARAQREDPLPRRAEARLWRGYLAQPGAAGGMRRLIYELNRLLPCASPVIAAQAVAQLSALPAALEAAAASPSRAATGPVDRELLAFIAARQELGAAPPPEALGADGAPAAETQLELLARLQARLHPAPLPALAGWLAALAAPRASEWRNPAHRAALTAELERLAADGLLAPMLAVLRDPRMREADATGYAAASAECARIDAALAALTDGGAGRAALSRRLGQELAVGIGIAALTAALGMALFG
ncbi:MAG: hypothetical protein ACP5NP_05595 [Acetobacteraceae bacterium]